MRTSRKEPFPSVPAALGARLDVGGVPDGRAGHPGGDDRADHHQAAARRFAMYAGPGSRRAPGGPAAAGTGRPIRHGVRARRRRRTDPPAGRRGGPGDAAVPGLVPRPGERQRLPGRARPRGARPVAGHPRRGQRAACDGGLPAPGRRPAPRAFGAGVRRQRRWPRLDRGVPGPGLVRHVRAAPGLSRVTKPAGSGRPRCRRTGPPGRPNTGSPRCCPARSAGTIRPRWPGGRPRR